MQFMLKFPHRFLLHLHCNNCDYITLLMQNYCEVHSNFEQFQGKCGVVFTVVKPPVIS